MYNKKNVSNYYEIIIIILMERWKKRKEYAIKKVLNEKIIYCVFMVVQEMQCLI